MAKKTTKRSVQYERYSIKIKGLTKVRPYFLIQRYAGAGSGGRTRTLSPGPDFESGTSANSIIPANLLSG